MLFVSRGVHFPLCKAFKLMTCLKCWRPKLAVDIDIDLKIRCQQLRAMMDRV